MDHPLIGKRIEHPAFEGGIVAYVTTDADDDFVALVITDTGEMQYAKLWVQSWNIVTPKPTGTTTADPNGDRWVPFDGTGFERVVADAHIVVKCKDGQEFHGPTYSFKYHNSGDNSDIVAWRRA